MKFRKIILQFIESAWRKLRLCFSSRKRGPSDFVEENSENSEGQNLKNSPPEERAKTKDEASKDDEEPNPNSSLPTQPDPSKETASLPKQPPEESQTQVPGETPEPSSQKETGFEKPESQSGSGPSKDSKKQTKPGQTPGQREDEPNQPAENGNRPAKPQSPQCRFVCYEDNGRWVVALAIEAGQNAQSVRQGNKELSANDCRYILDDLGAEVTVEFKGGHPPQSFQLLKEDKKEDQFVVFKMRKDWKGEGQKVKTLSSGDYVVFAHKSCGQRIGTPPIEAEQCRYPDFTAHFFSISEDSEMNDGFENCSLPFSSAKRFSLKGQRFPDDSDLGELFGEDAPQLDDAEKWREISWIVVGRENGGKVLAKFHPEEKTLAEVLGERSGWFFVRIYDANVDLLHSFPFRRAKGLNNIFVNNQPLEEVAPIVPSINGHTETSVQFEGEVHVRPKDDSDGIKPEKENTFAVSPQDKDELPHPDNDKTKWILGSGEDCVKAEILLPRIWWKFIEEEGKEGDWQDTPIKMEREAFRRAGNEKIRIRFSFRIPEIVVGFGDLNSTDNPTLRTKLSKDRKTCEVELRLYSFADYQAIEKPLRKAIYLWVKLKDSDIIFPIVHIPADAPPPDDAKPKPKPSKPKSDVDKSFSLEELKRAKEELDKELEEKAKAALQSGLMTDKELKALKNPANYKVTIQDKSSLRILSIRDIRDGGKPHQIPLNRHRESMQSNRKKVEDLKAFFRKHFEKE